MCTFFSILNSYVCRIRHIIPKWNTLFKKGCVSAAVHNHHQGLIDKWKDTKMMPPYALALENVTTYMGLISSHSQRKIDARHYNGFLLTPGIVYHMTSKIQNSLLNDHYGNPFEVGIINFITRFGNYMQKTPYLIFHRAHSKKYVYMMATYVNGCGGEEQIIPVTMFLVMLYNACFMYQSDKRSNLLITALDTFNLGASIDHENFMNTLSESNH
jgi:hypothetical protein